MGRSNNDKIPRINNQTARNILSNDKKCRLDPLDVGFEVSVIDVDGDDIQR